MNVPMIALPQGPTLPDFEAVLDHATQSKATFRRAFVERFFDFMLGKRMNCKTDGFVGVVMAEVVARFTALYEANVFIQPDDPWRSGFWFGNVAEWLTHRKLSEDTAEIINVALEERIMRIQSRYAELMFNEMFVAHNNEGAIVVVNRWLDHMQFLSEIGDGRGLIAPRRELTILARAHDLLMGHVGTNEGR